MTLPYQCTPDDQQWAGLACSEDEPCPIYLELNAAESSGARLFVAGNIHSSTVTLYSVLLASDDSGLTWREAHPRIRGAGLDHMQFFDTATGWAGGEVLFPLPRDPFLLLTTDGGRSWRQRPFFGETFPGSLQQFLFTSRTSGSAILDRGPEARASATLFTRRPMAAKPGPSGTRAIGPWIWATLPPLPLRGGCAPTAPPSHSTSSGWRASAGAAWRLSPSS